MKLKALQRFADRMKNEKLQSLLFKLDLSMPAVKNMEDAAMLYKQNKAPMLSKSDFSAKITSDPMMKKGRPADFELYAEEVLDHNGYDTLKRVKKDRKKAGVELMNYLNEMKGKML